MTDSASDSGFGTWFDAASAFATSSNALAQHGSQLTSTTMNFAGAAQASSGVGAVATAGSSVLIDFQSDSTQLVSFLVGLSSSASGSGTSTVVLTLTDLTTGVVRLSASANVAFSGSLTLDSGHNYRLAIDADTTALGESDSLGQYNVGFESPIPAPGALALLGLSGIGGLRSRRRR